MSQVKMTRDKIERRITDNLRKTNTNMGLAKPDDMSVTYSERNSPLVDSPEAMTFSQRLRYIIVVKFLHKINLTSYRRLRRAYAVIDEIQMDLTNLIQERDEIVQLLRTVSSDRDRLAGQVQAEKPEREQLRTELETLRRAHTRLQQDHETLRSVYDVVSHKNTALEAVMNLRNSQHADGENLEKPAALPLTVKGDTLIPYNPDVERRLTSW